MQITNFKTELFIITSLHKTVTSQLTFQQQHLIIPQQIEFSRFFLKLYKYSLLFLKLYKIYNSWNNKNTIYNTLFVLIFRAQDKLHLNTFWLPPSLLLFSYAFFRGPSKSDFCYSPVERTQFIILFYQKAAFNVLFARQNETPVPQAA